MKKTMIGILLLLGFASISTATMLQWDQYQNQANITGFIIYSRETGATETFSEIVSDPAVTTYQLNQQLYEPGKSYEFWLTAFNSLAESEQSNIVTWTAPVWTPTEKPRNVVINIPAPIGSVQINVE